MGEEPRLNLLLLVLGPLTVIIVEPYRKQQALHERH